MKDCVLESEEFSMNDSGQSHERLGATLAAARSALGLELADIARDTRVPIRHLRAIEADAHDSLPAIPYTIGFVKALAQAVGVDPEAAAAQFRAETSKTAHIPATLALEPLDERRLPPRGLVVLTIGIAVALIAGLIAYGAGVFDQAAPPPPIVVDAAPAPAATSVVEPVPAAIVAETGAPPVSTPGAMTVPITAAPVATGAGVTLTATEDVWIKISDTARNTVMMGILKPGEVYNVPAGPPALLLWTGKAGALRVAVGGRVIAPLGGPVQTVRNVSLNAADLVARNVAVAPAATGAR